MLQVDSNSPSQTNTSPNAGVVPVSNQAFGNALRGLKEQKFSVICNIFENNEDGLRELLGNPTPPVEALVARFGELEAGVVAKRLILHSAKTHAVDRGDNSSFTAQLQSELGSVLEGFGMDTQRPPCLDRALAKFVQKAILEHSSNPQSQPLIICLERAAKNFFAARDVVDFRAIGLARIAGVLRALGDETGRASDVQDRPADQTSNSAPKLVFEQCQERQVKVLTDILKVFVGAREEESPVKELLETFPQVVEQLMQDEPLRKSVLSNGPGEKNPKAVAIVLETLLERSSCVKERAYLLQITMPEALRFVGQAGVRALRADLNFDNITDLRKADECVRDAVVTLETRTKDPELALYLVNRSLQFSAELFEAKKDTRNGISIVEFDIEAVQETVDSMVNILKQSSGNTEKNIDNWKRTVPFEQLPEWYQKAIEEEVKYDRSTSDSVGFVLKNQIEADKIGLKAEQLAEDILNDLVEDGTIAHFSKSLKNSDADRLGLDYAIWLPDGSVIYVDIKSSETGAYHADGKRIEFAEHIQMDPSLSFIGPYEEAKILFLRSALVVISPDSRDECNKTSILDALSTATTLPYELRPIDVTEALRPWQSPNDRRW